VLGYDEEARSAKHHPCRILPESTGWLGLMIAASAWRDEAAEALEWVQARMIWKLSSM
jgi:hypothetical protein